MALSDSFEWMELPMSATPSEVRAKWRDVAKACHPDLGHSLVKFLAAKARMEACLDHALKPRMCFDCHGLGKVVASSQGFKTIYKKCVECGGSGKISLP